MAKKKTGKIRSKTVVITLEQDKSVFGTIWPFKGQEEIPELEGVQEFRRLLSNEKARVLFVIRSKNPQSIYELAKLLGRDFKSVRQDVKLFEKFGLIKLERLGKIRKKLKPTLVLDELHVTFKL
jgi:predicted transcriptional regulator